MPPQIKQDLNRSGWETTDFPSVCENCLPDNPYVQMLKEDYSAECKLCTRPFTLFQWKSDRTSRSKATNICLTCARLKNCCQCCMLDLSFGLPIAVRDAALKMVAPGPQSSINREYFAQNHEKELEEGRGLDAYEKTDEKARDLLRKLAHSEPYYKRQRRLEGAPDGPGSALDSAQDSPKRIAAPPGPIRTHDHRLRGGSSRGGRGGRGGSRTSATSGVPRPEEIAPPDDPNITSLFVTGVEDDLPEHAVRKFFAAYGTLRSVICSHRAHCAFINYSSREGAEAAALACQGRAAISGCPLRVRWGKPKPLDSMDQDERMMYARQGRETAAAVTSTRSGGSNKAIGNGTEAESSDAAPVALPPGQEDFQYASLAGD